MHPYSVEKIQEKVCGQQTAHRGFLKRVGFLKRPVEAIRSRSGDGTYRDDGTYWCYRAASKRRGLEDQLESALKEMFEDESGTFSSSDDDDSVMMKMVVKRSYS